jgi:hypothetical protein
MESASQFQDRILRDTSAALDRSTCVMVYAAAFEVRNCQLQKIVCHSPLNR